MECVWQKLRVRIAGFLCDWYYNGGVCKQHIQVFDWIYRL
jgi:hypothetical protein